MSETPSHSLGGSLATVQDLAGQLLISHPRSQDSDFNKSVILVASADSNIVVGVQLDTVMPELVLSEVCYRMDIAYSGTEPIYRGGDRGVGRVHVIHSSDWSGITTVSITPEISITNDLSVLAALSVGDGPARFRACAGHWSWQPPQLENQFRSGQNWVVLPSDPDLVFDQESERQWRTCINRYTLECGRRWFDRLGI